MRCSRRGTTDRLSAAARLVALLRGRVRCRRDAASAAGGSKVQENRPRPEKNGFVCCFYLWRVFLREKKTIPGSGLRAPAKPVAGAHFSPRDGAPSPPPLMEPFSTASPPGGPAGYKIGFSARSCGSLLYLSHIGESLWC
jgi:hypothetical protein